MVSPQTLEVLVKGQKFQAGAWQRVIEEARKYAQMKTSGTVIENGHRLSLSHSSIEGATALFAENLLRAAVEAFLEDAQMGAELFNAGETS